MWLFAGRLPDLNIGTGSGASANTSIADAVLDAAAASADGAGWPSRVLNGRFKGGYITRHYGAPKNGVHAVQLEMCQALYMQEKLPFAYDMPKAARIQPVLKSMMTQALAACTKLYGA